MLTKIIKRTLPSQQKVFVRNQSTIKSFLPNMEGVNGSTTLGNVWDRVYVKYRYRLIWPIVGWVGFLYATLWTPLAPQSVKNHQLARMEKLKNMEFSQQD